MTWLKSFKIVVFVLFSCVLLASCTSIDLTKGHGNIIAMCRLHKEPMKKEVVYVYGSHRFVPGYADLANKEFPNHGGHLYNMEREGIPSDRNIVTYVCPSCHKLYLEYGKKNSLFKDEPDK
jgi:hypothetical protein